MNSIHFSHIKKHISNCKKPLLSVFFSCFFLISSSQLCFAAEPISKIGFFLDTVIKIDLYDSEDTTLLDQCCTMLNDYENMLSKTRSGSDIWNINHSGGTPVEVSEETAFLIEKALHYSEISDGAFDITIAPVVALWTFEGNTESVMPEDSDITSNLEHVDYHNVLIEHPENGNPLVTLKDPDASIDLGGIAKGYIADRLKDYLTSEGVTSGMINLGGNMLVIGVKPDGSNWRIGVRDPQGNEGELIAVVQMDDSTLVTSGTYERCFEKDGVRYHHILDPDNGYPTWNGLSSVSILTDSSADADALSTTCFILGLEKGMELIESLDGTEALFIEEDNTMHRSTGFPE